MKRIICHLLFLLCAPVYAGTEDFYNFKWLSTDKKIFVLQNKFFSKKRTAYVNVGMGNNANTDFQDTSLLHFSAGYYFTEQWGIEFFSNKYSNSNSDSFDKVSSSNLTVPLVRRFTAATGGSLLYSPFYGKLNAFNKILYFELILGAGLGSLTTENNIEAFENNDPQNEYISESLSEVHWNLKLRVNITKRFIFNTDLYNYYYSASDSSTGESKELKSAKDLIFSLGYSI